jgi:hypothetical protein
MVDAIQRAQAQGLITAADVQQAKILGQQAISSGNTDTMIQTLQKFSPPLVAAIKPYLPQGAQDAIAGAGKYLPFAGILYGIATRDRQAATQSAAGATGSFAGAAIGVNAGYVTSISGAPVAAGAYLATGIGVAVAAVVIVCQMLGNAENAAKTKFSIEQQKRQNIAWSQLVAPTIMPMLTAYINGDRSQLPNLASAAASSLYTAGKTGDFPNQTALGAFTRIFAVVAQNPGDYQAFLILVANLMKGPGYYNTGVDNFYADPFSVVDAWKFLSNNGAISIPAIYPWGQGVVPWDQYQAAFAQGVAVPGVIVNPRAGGGLTLAPLGWTIGPKPSTGLTWQQIQSTPAALIQAPRVISYFKYQAAMAQNVDVPGTTRINGVLTLAPGWTVGPATGETWAQMQSTPAAAIVA